MTVEWIADAGERLDRFLAAKMPEHSRSRLARWIEDGHVRVQGIPAKPGTKLRAGDVVACESPEAREVHDLTPADIPLTVVFEDDQLLVVDKPRGMATHPAPSLREPTLVNALLARSHHLSEGSAPYRPGIVHRLDKDTSGLLLVAKTDQAHHKLAAQIAAKTAVRRYLAVLHGRVEPDAFLVTTALGRDRRNRERMTADPNGKPAQTRIDVLRTESSRSLVLAQLDTGRTHQIRVHAQLIGHPVLGDRLYHPQDRETPTLQLRACFVAFTHPTRGERIRLYAPPDDTFIMSAAGFEPRITNEEHHAG